MTQSIHVPDLLQWLAGPVRSVFARTRTALHAIEVEDLAVAVLRLESGALGVIESATCAYPAFKSRIEVHGERGSAIVNGEHDELMFWRVSDSVEQVDAPEGFRFADVADPRGLPELRLPYVLQDMVDSVREDREPFVNGEEGWKSLVIARAIYESAESGREVTVSNR
jgi:UDP-N-acetyl-2-amino-2-deoxyglucuronate dehydrogenase